MQHPPILHSSSPQYVYLNILLDNEWKTNPVRHIRYSLLYNNDRSLDDIKRMYLSKLSDEQINFIRSDRSSEDILSYVDKGKLVDIIYENIRWEKANVTSKLDLKHWLLYKSSLI